MQDPAFSASVLAIAACMSVTHYLSHRISVFMEEHHYRVLSFSGGSLIALIFLVLLPETVRIARTDDVYLLLLAGFVAFHLTEKYLYQHVRNKCDLLEDLRELHVAGFFVDHFILGFVLVTTVELTPQAGYLILIPVFLHTISSSITMEHIHETAETHVHKLLLSASPLLGAIVALALEVEAQTEASVLAFIIGMLLYIVNRDIIPKEEKGRPAMFITGLAVVVVPWFLISH